MATHSSVLAWRIPGTGEPGVFLSVGLLLLVTALASDTGWLLLAATTGLGRWVAPLSRA